MKITIEELKNILVPPGYLGDKDFISVLEESDRSGKNIETILVDQGFIKEEDLGRIIAESKGFRFIDLKKERIPFDILVSIPQMVATSLGVIPVVRVEDGVNVGMRNPDDIELIHLMEKRLGEKVFPFYITRQGLESVISQYNAGLKDDFDKILKMLQDPSLSKEEKDNVTVQMVDLLLRYGYENKASDIHIEPYKEKINIRFRIDGIMHDVLDIPKQFADFIVTRIKIMGRMRTDEHRAAQDGKFQFTNGKDDIDIRVSIVPVTEGENIVMRILSEKGRQFSLTDIGLLERDLEKVKRASSKPHGMILVTGPTGSGKTTTLYAIIKILNKREVHISTIEDPVEYEIEGVSQIQVNVKTDLTFAKGLRSIVRQDPDIIMVGEIRDEETAGIAVNSAMTGHLVLSTLHANDSATTLPRLLDMNIEPFLISSTVNVVIAQRLVRKICEKCRASYEMDDEQIQMIENNLEIKTAFEKLGYKKDKKVLLYKGTGCDSCMGTGYLGRIGIFEVLEMTDNIKELVVSRKTSDDIMKVAREEGMVTMLEDGIFKILQGMTTLEEVLRVTKT